MTIAENLCALRDSIPDHVSVVAVSKTQPAGLIMEAYRAGQRDFGENRLQELVLKHTQLPGDVRWHFIGHLQTNKVRTLIPLVSLIHSVDSKRLLETVDLEARRIGRVVECLLQFHIATEESKFGLNLEEAESLLRSVEYGRMQNVRIAGVMGMASFTDDSSLVRREFRSLRQYFSSLKEAHFSSCPEFRILSMGMSGDYRIAIEEGSNMVRIGTAIFGERTKG